MLLVNTPEQFVVLNRSELYIFEILERLSMFEFTQVSEFGLSRVRAQQCVGDERAGQSEWQTQVQLARRTRTASD